MTRLHTIIPGYLGPEDTVTIRFRPNEKHVTLRLAAQMVSTPISELRRQLKETGMFRNERYAISLHAPKEQ